MIFALKKVIGFCLMPLQLSLLAMTLGLALLAFTRWRRAGRTLLVGGFVWLALMSNKGIGTFLLRTLESRHPAQAISAEGPSADLRACEAIVVLGAGHADTHRLPPTLRLSASALSRLGEGVRLARILPAVPLWVSGPAANDGRPTHARILREAALALGLAPDRIHEDPHGLDTEGEARALSKSLGARRIALVTSAWHMTRATRCFEREGFTVVACPADFIARANDDFRAGDYFSWDLTGLERSTKATYEFLGSTWARMRDPGRSR